MCFGCRHFIKILDDDEWRWACVPEENTGESPCYWTDEDIARYLKAG